MIITDCQQYILDCLREIPYIRDRHLLWLLRLKYGLSIKQGERSLRQLAYLDKIDRHVDSGGFSSLPGQRRDPALLAAADVMAEVCGENLPEFLRGERPCTLSFYLRDTRGYLDFKVVPVPLGEEQHVVEQLYRRYQGFKCTWLFLPESREQIESLRTENPACFVFKNESGGYDFLRRQ
ncbi:hypothetical protein DWV16_10975 [Anaerotruncus sp. AF02-27]|uniref:hypothetical protein n=1 Tax=Anaerotruncus TaxID=244127 RepID=UPI000E4A19AE|nr:hypothetical protein [Anaerotruncus sp. AF02-27]RGX55087.1 hypothetical protein DWV16_10975 [Anaerotruncus sp. AF02-27]GKH48118.1 hypothetical protein CE91St45_26800 [Oscillospiraceae bacterium]